MLSRLVLPMRPLKRFLMFYVCMSLHERKVIFFYFKKASVSMKTNLIASMLSFNICVEFHHNLTRTFLKCPLLSPPLFVGHYPHVWTYYISDASGHKPVGPLAVGRPLVAVVRGGRLRAQPRPILWTLCHVHNLGGQGEGATLESVRSGYFHPGKASKPFNYRWIRTGSHYTEK